MTVASANAAFSIGMNGRFFPNNWRPAPREIDFAARAGFSALQFPGPEEGLGEQHLGASLREVGACLRAAGVAPVMEIVVRVDTPAGKTASGRTPLEILGANLPALSALGCAQAHWHLVLRHPGRDEAAPIFEAAFVDSLSEAVAIAAREGFRFGIEQNEPAWPPFRSPDACADALAAVAGLGFVWDLNHAPPADVPAYLALAPRMQMLHVADTPLPVVNHHLPLGQGAIDFAAYFAALHQGGFSGPAILEIGGLPKSGGYGRDTDDALIDSAARLRRCLAESGLRLACGDGKSGGDAGERVNVAQLGRAEFAGQHSLEQGDSR